MTKMITWSIGNVMKKIREEQGISQSLLCNGICSVATLSRIESGERDMDYLLVSRIFERLGYSVDKFEFYGTIKEIEQWNQRHTMRLAYNTGDYELLEKYLSQYEIVWEKEIKDNILQLQLLTYIKGILAIQKRQLREGKQLLEKALTYTVPDWNMVKAKKIILGETELQILGALGDACRISGEIEKANNFYQYILYFFEKSEIKKEEMSQLYVNTVCKIVPVYIKKKYNMKSLELCEDAIRILSKKTQVIHWADLLYWKGKSLEAILDEEKKTSLNLIAEIVETYKRAYYVYRMFGDENSAKAVRRHLEEIYKWECIT